MGLIAPIKKRIDGLKMKDLVLYQRTVSIIFGLIIFFVYSFFLIRRVNINFGDDTDFYIHVFDQMSLWEYIVSRYNGWSSRVVIDVFVAGFVHFPLLWKLITSVLAVVIYLEVVNICDRSGAFSGSVCFRILAFLLVLTYPFFNDMQSAGWIATSMNYYWVLAALLYCLICLLKWYDDHKLSIAECILFLFTFIYGTNQEQAAVIFEIICVSTLVIKVLTNHKLDKRLLFCSLICFAVIVYELTCPGNSARAAANTAYWMPSFAEFSIADKVYMALFAVYEYFICGYETVYKPVLVGIILIMDLAVLLMHKKKTVMMKGMIWIVASAILLQIMYIIRWIKAGISYGFIDKILYNPGLIDRVDWASKRSFMPLLITAIIVISIAGTVCIAGKTYRCIELIMILAGLLSEMIIGFSPTIWASSERTAIFTYFLWGDGAIMLFIETLEHRQWTKTVDH